MRRSILRQLSSLKIAIAGDCRGLPTLGHATAPILRTESRACPVLVRPLASGGSRLLSTDSVEKQSEEKKTADTTPEPKTDNAPTEEILDTDLPDSEAPAQESAENVIEQYQIILEEKDEALRKMSAQLEDERKKVLLGLAEAENLRTRFQRESTQTRKFAVQGFVQKLLSCLDNLDRAVDSFPSSLVDVEDASGTDRDELLKALQGLAKGVQLTQNEFKNVLQSNGVVRYDPVGEAFDPNEHMARFELEDATKEPGTVGVVTLCGYKMHERIIRPAEVGVVRRREEESGSAVDERSESGA